MRKTINSYIDILNRKQREREKREICVNLSLLINHKPNYSIRYFSVGHVLRLLLLFMSINGRY